MSAIERLSAEDIDLARTTDSPQCALFQSASERQTGGNQRQGASITINTQSVYKVNLTRHREGGKKGDDFCILGCHLFCLPLLRPDQQIKTGFESAQTAFLITCLLLFYVACCNSADLQWPKSQNSQCLWLLILHVNVHAHSKYPLVLLEDNKKDGK